MCGRLIFLQILVPPRSFHTPLAYSPTHLLHTTRPQPFDRLLFFPHDLSALPTECTLFLRSASALPLVSAFPHAPPGSRKPLAPFPNCQQLSLPFILVCRPLHCLFYGYVGVVRRPLSRRPCSILSETTRCLPPAGRFLMTEPSKLFPLPPSLPVVLRRHTLGIRTLAMLRHACSSFARPVRCRLVPVPTVAYRDPLLAPPAR